MRCRDAARSVRKAQENQLEYGDNTPKREEHEQQGPVATRPVSKHVAQGARPRFDLSGERHQAAGPDRVVRPIRRAVAQLGHADGLQARHLDRRALAPDQLGSGEGSGVGCRKKEVRQPPHPPPTTARRSSSASISATTTLKSASRKSCAWWSPPASRATG